MTGLNSLTPTSGQGRVSRLQDALGEQLRQAAFGLGRPSEKGLFRGSVVAPSIPVARGEIGCAIPGVDSRRQWGDNCQAMEGVHPIRGSGNCD